MGAYEGIARRFLRERGDAAALDPVEGRRGLRQRNGGHGDQHDQDNGELPYKQLTCEGLAPVWPGRNDHYELNLQWSHN
ncbi:hypothetical protein GCM10018780_12460 [Streptomyces lanatus]|nr:hypothetical protein GCM10018780_12460 [Streptomyces lanatus]